MQALLVIKYFKRLHLRKPKQHIYYLCFAITTVGGWINLKKRNLRHNNSGQVIVITSLLVALVLLSTAMYVIETDKNVPSVGSGIDDAFPAYQQSIRNTLLAHYQT